MKRSCRIQSIASTLCLAILVLAGCGSTPPLKAEAEHRCAESAYIEITNTGTGEVSLAGWTIKDSSGEHQLPTLRLAPQAKLRIWRGSGVDDAANLYLAQPSATWRLGSGGEGLVIDSPPPFWLWETSLGFLFGCNVDPPMYSNPTQVVQPES
ncbi:MAG: lamin tail domain-containing protein [Chloroflexales bacterium]